jgi:hypothetical protein
MKRLLAGWLGLFVVPVAMLIALAEDFIEDLKEER